MATVASPRPAAAKDSVLIDYQAPSECPTQAVFEHQLNVRLVANRRPNAVAEREPTTVRVRITKRAAGGYGAELVTENQLGPSSPRTLEGPDCAALTEALAFTTALALEPGRENAATTVDSDAATTAPNTAPNAAPNTAPNAAPSQTRPPEPPPAPPSPSSSPPPSRPSDRAAPRDQSPEPEPDSGPAPMVTWDTSLGAGVSIASPLNTGFDRGFYAQLGLSQSEPHPISRSWSPAFTFGVHVLRNPWTGNGQEASFYLTSVDVSFCPSVLVAGGFSARPCANVQGGLLYARGENLSNPRRSQVQVLSGGGMLALEYELSSYLGVTGRLGAQVELHRHAFEVGLQPTVVAESRTVSPWFSLGLVTHL